MDKKLTLRERLMLRILLICAKIASDNNYGYKTDIDEVITYLKTFGTKEGE
jgi:hypothetical protein